jgi:hypothetical protein
VRDKIPTFYWPTHPHRKGTHVPDSTTKLRGSDDTEKEKGGPKKFKFSVDGREFETDQRSLTGAQIKALASIDPSFGLFLESRGNRPDQQIADSQTVHLGEPGREQFYAVPPATFGGRR